jgi:hypothetical protein
MITPFSAAIAFRIASLLDTSFLFGFLESLIIFSSFGSRFCLANASTCHARHKSFSNFCSFSNFFCLARSVNSYGVYSPTTNGSIPKFIIARSAKAKISKVAAFIPP